VKTVWRWDEPFRHNTSVWRTDGQTDVQPISVTCAVWLTLVNNVDASTDRRNAISNWVQYCITSSINQLNMLNVVIYLFDDDIMWFGCDFQKILRWTNAVCLLVVSNDLDVWNRCRFIKSIYIQYTVSHHLLVGLLLMLLVRYSRIWSSWLVLRTFLSWPSLSSVLQCTSRWSYESLRVSQDFTLT